MGDDDAVAIDLKDGVGNDVGERRDLGLALHTKQLGRIALTGEQRDFAR